MLAAGKFIFFFGGAPPGAFFPPRQPHQIQYAKEHFGLPTRKGIVGTACNPLGKAPRSGTKRLDQWSAIVDSAWTRNQGVRTDAVSILSDSAEAAITAKWEMMRWLVPWLSNVRWPDLQPTLLREHRCATFIVPVFHIEAHDNSRLLHAAVCWSAGKAKSCGTYRKVNMVVSGKRNGKTMEAAKTPARTSRISTCDSEKAGKFRSLTTWRSKRWNDTGRKAPRISMAPLNRRKNQHPPRAQWSSGLLHRISNRAAKRSVLSQPVKIQRRG